MIIVITAHFGASWAAIKPKLCRPPHHIASAASYGVGPLTGIGFTMGHFIGSLAFADRARATGIRLGVFPGSILSCLCGYLLLRVSGDREAGSRIPAARLRRATFRGWRGDVNVAPGFQSLQIAICGSRDIESSEWFSQHS
ncbi:Na+/H+ antiporter NhaA [Labrys miyagiensis]|uniref:Na+/H+ antiporter NhaA n=1 Tax=Labrys miyagiensis TaxID=346912 RepID=UPI003D677484